MPRAADPAQEQPITRVVLVEGQPASVLQAGDVFFEPEGERIARFDAGDDGVTFLAYYLLSPGQDPQITFPGQ
jgi:hypothetical protein